MEPGDTPDVPRPIAVVRDFVNTTDRETAADDLKTPADLTRYLVAHGLMPRASRATPTDLDLALRLRSALRHALEQNHAGARAPSSPPDVLAEHPVTLTWSAEGAVLTTTAPGVRGALARVAIAVHEATTGRPLAASEDLRVRRVRVGLLRPVQEPLPLVVRVRLRQQGEDPGLPGAQGRRIRLSDRADSSRRGGSGRMAR